jgi:hypothetical protein
MPYIVSRKVGFYVWETIVQTIGKPNQKRLLTNDPENDSVAETSIGKVFTIAEFSIFFYRVCILAFDTIEHGPHI